MDTVDFLLHENSPTWAGVEPGNVGVEGQRLTNYATQPGWIGWLVRPRLRVRPLLKSVDFHYAENRQRPCRMIIQHVKNP
ncbi:hypothetical protein TNCV_689481 [Trichonephila clavipes]|nr:hypothetical protein TNCV_689481 [Trichonephila clavipes]